MSATDKAPNPPSRGVSRDHRSSRKGSDGRPTAGQALTINRDCSTTASIVLCLQACQHRPQVEVSRSFDQLPIVAAHDVVAQIHTGAIGFDLEVTVEIGVEVRSQTRREVVENECFVCTARSGFAIDRATDVAARRPCQGDARFAHLMFSVPGEL